MLPIAAVLFHQGAAKGEKEGGHCHPQLDLRSRPHSPFVPNEIFAEYNGTPGDLGWKFGDYDGFMSKTAYIWACDW